MHFLYSKYSQLTFELEKYFENEKFNITESEKIWLKDDAYFNSVPITLKEDYFIFKYYGKNTILQGKNNGPDFILKNKNNGITMGIEIEEYMPVIIDMKSKNIVNPDLYLQKLYSSIDKKMSITTEEKMKLINESIIKKIDKSEKYQKVDIICLFFIMNNKIQGFEYYFFEWWKSLNFLGPINENPFLDIYFI